VDASQLTIIAIDPGKMTGYAELRLGEFTSGQTDHISYYSYIMSALMAGLRPAIVCEDFIYTAATAKKTRQTWSTEGIGILRFMAFRYSLSFNLQAPVDAKKFATNDKLKAMGWYVPTKGGHANDAARHLLLYCVKNKIIDPRPLLEIQPDQIEET